jgi:hypothetical protein
MSNNPGTGSVLLKIAIVVLALLLVLVIKIPDSIWEQEANEKNTSHYNMSSIYEAEKHFHRLTNKYTSDIDDLLKEIRNDSSIVQTQQLVTYTQQLAKAIDNYLAIDLINGLMIIDQNISTIIEDLNTNERYFRIDENVKNEAEQIKIDLSIFVGDVKYPNYSQCVTYIDSVNQLRRDLSDYSLQTASSMAVNLSGKANGFLSGVELDEIQGEWKAISLRLEKFRVMVNAPHISQNTSVGARIKEFAAKIAAKFNALLLINQSDDVNKALVSQKSFNDIYQSFLKDFIITDKRSQYRLSLEDSMVLYISEQNFMSPVNGDQYKMMISPDSSDIKIESPVLLEDLRTSIKPASEKIKNFDFLKPYFELADSIKAVIDKGVEIKAQLKRNLQVTVKNAELKDNLNTYKGSSEYKAASDLMGFIKIVDSSQSYSEMKEAIGNARNAVGIFQQIYGNNLFDNIDSLSKDIIANLDEYNTILSEISRLPKGVEKFDNESSQLNQIVTKIKQKTASNDPNNLLGIQSQLEDALLFASEGKTERRYLVFEKSIENFGYVYKNTKSWEEEKEK